MATTFYVDPNGNDGNDGSIGSPFQTLAAAQTAVRAEIAGPGLGTDGIIVMLRSGDWELAASLALTSLDSGESGKPVVWRAYPGETVRILGSKTLDSAWFSLVTSGHSEWARIPAAAQGNVYMCNLLTNGISDYGTLRVTSGGNEVVAALELFSDESPMQLARWPNPDTPVTLAAYTTVDTSPTTTTFTLGAAHTARMTNWETAPEPWFFGYWYYHWAPQAISATSIIGSTRTVTLAQAPSYGIQVGLELFVENVLEELDTAGQWYLERSTNILYWWPNGTIGNLDIKISILETPIMTITGSEYLQFEGISFGLGRQRLVTVDNGTDVTFNNCRFFGTGTDAVQITNGTNHSIQRSEIYDIGENGVRMNGGDRATLTPSNHLVKNCDIHHFGRRMPAYKVAARADGVGQTISHNNIHDGPAAAILFKGNEHLIEYNEINNMCQLSSDVGAIYAYQHWGWRGNEINYNYIHDVSTIFAGVGVIGVYIDGMMSGVSVFGNYFIDISKYAMFNNGGRDCIYENNLVVRCHTLFRTSSAATYAYNDTPGSGSNLLERLGDDGVQYQGATWTAAYPEVAAIPNDNAIITNPALDWLYPEECVCARNHGWGNTFFLTDQQSTSYDYFAEVADNVADLDPMFVNEAGGDLNLNPGSPVYNITGWVEIPFDDIGIEPLVTRVPQVMIGGLRITNNGSRVVVT